MAGGRAGRQDSEEDLVGDFIPLDREEQPRRRKNNVNLSVKFSEFSVTVGTPGKDIVKGETKPGLEKFVEEYCKSAYFGLERGSSREYLHWQGVVVTKEDMCASVLNKKLKVCLGWLEPESEGKTHVKVKALTHNNDLHTSIGMLGYCSKDMGKEHFDDIRKEVTDEMLERGKEIYAMLGNTDFKQKVCLTRENIFERAFIFWLYSHSVARYFTPPFIQVVAKMLRTGNYFLSADWVTKSHEGMNEERAESLWQVMCGASRQGFSTIDLQKVLFYSKSEQFRYFQNLENARLQGSRRLHRFKPAGSTRPGCYFDEVSRWHLHDRVTCDCQGLPPDNFMEFD